MANSRQYTISITCSLWPRQTTIGHPTIENDHTRNIHGIQITQTHTHRHMRAGIFNQYRGPDFHAWQVNWIWRNCVFMNTLLLFLVLSNGYFFYFVIEFFVRVSVSFLRSLAYFLELFNSWISRSLIWFDFSFSLVSQLAALFNKSS